MREPPAGGCTHGKVVAMAAAALLAVFGAVAETRIGIIGLDTSHAVAFTKVINVDRPPWTEGFRVTSAYQWGSRDIFSSTNRYPEYIAKVREMGVAVVPTIDELIESVDVVCLETNDGQANAVVGNALVDVELFYEWARQSEMHVVLLVFNGDNTRHTFNYSGKHNVIYDLISPTKVRISEHKTKGKRKFFPFLSSESTFKGCLKSAE